MLAAPAQCRTPLKSTLAWSLSSHLARFPRAVLESELFRPNLPLPLSPLLGVRPAVLSEGSLLLLLLLPALQANISLIYLICLGLWSWQTDADVPPFPHVQVLSRMERAFTLYGLLFAMSGA